MTADRVAYRTCPLCEATCGLEIVTRGSTIVSVRGDTEDVFSAGFICPKGVGLKQLHEDPDRVRTPLLRQADGSFAACSWDEAFAVVDRRLGGVLAGGDRNAVGIYIGNPNAHNLSNLLYGPVLMRALGTRQVFSASTVDQFPKQMASALMFGTGLSVPVPDVDNTDWLMVLGANPLASNGSLLTAPNMRGRLRAIRGRGGRVVVVDPRRSRTAQEADEHVFIRPGTDALLLFAIAHVLFEEGLVSVAGAVGSYCEGIEEVASLAADFAPAAVAAACGVPADTIVRLARELAAAPSAAVYGRIGTCTQEFGGLASWLVDVLNVLTGNLDRRGGAMFPRAAAGARNAAGTPGRGRGAAFGRWSSRVRGLGEIFGELPVACLAEEIDTPGEGQIRALITVAGNPVVSTPNAGRLEQALGSLELMVSLDAYVNETTRHADVILPAPSPLRRAHYDLALYQFAARNVANYSPPVLEPEEGLPDEWVTLVRLAGIAGGQGPDVDVAAMDEMVAVALVRREVGLPGGVLEGRSESSVLEALEPRRGPERLLDLMLRVGPYGEGFGGRPDGLSLAVLEAAPHGVDLGPLQPRIPEVLRTASGKIELAPEPLVSDVPRLRAALAREAARNGDGGLVLIGRRQLRSNNSWMHNLPLLVSGPPGCTMHVHPGDAARLGLVDGGVARVSSRVGEIEVPVEVTDAIMPGVVSIPHGWGHGGLGDAQRVASAAGGVNSNLLADETLVDAVSGNAVLSGVPVEVVPLEVVAVV